jgi:hypothetical protein
MRLLRLLLALAVTAGLAACGNDDKTDTAASTTTTAAVKAMPLALTVSDTGIVGPAEVAAGLYDVTVQNDAKVPWQLNFAKLDAGKTVADLRAYDAAHSDDENAGPPPFVKLAGAVSAEAGRTGTITLVLTEADWAVVAFTEDEKTKPLDAELKVTTGDAAAKLPSTEASIDATEFKYTIKGLKAGTNHVTLRNTGGVAHIFVLFGLKPEGKLDDVLAFEGEGDAPGTTGFDRDLSYLDPGFAAITDLDLPAGKYGIVCFLNSPPNDPNGKPHFTLGMKQEFTVA